MVKKLNRMEWLALSIVMVVLFGLLTNIWDGFKYPMFIGFVYPVIFSLIQFWNLITRIK